MSDRFHPIPMSELCRWIFTELETHDSIFGIPRTLFFRPQWGDAFATEVYGQRLETPFGVAAGPHSQLAQNIVVAWLCGARFMELKTVQTLDRLEISKPCIDMQDVGYNVEWSQELRVHESLDEYLRAFVLIHALHRRLGLPGELPGVIFNTSVGYDLAGIRRQNVKAFLAGMLDGGELLAQHIDTARRFCSELRDVSLPSVVSDNVTLSTMHGCPPDEIGRIAAHLMEEWGLHTSVKLNPTLLGPQRVRSILNDELGYTEVVVPDAAFEHDPCYQDALELIGDLRETAEQHGVQFGVKLSNTLEVVNHRTVFAASEQQMYLSGRPLHALTANIAADLATEFGGELLISFAGGANAFNAPDLIAAGMSTVTTCSDLLGPGGYLRLLQYIDHTAKAMEELGARDIGQFACLTAERRGAGEAAGDARRAALDNLRAYAAALGAERTLHRDTFDRSHTKNNRALEPFDCIEAPCAAGCAIDQEVPEYMRAVRQGRLADAVAITRLDNQMAASLGQACDHLCEWPCVRTHHDQPLAIREIKRYIMEHEVSVAVPREAERAARETRVAIIGAGPCGLSAAGFLAEAGYRVELFEAHDYAGGMVAGTIPLFRASPAVVEQDLRRIEALGARIHTGVAAGPGLMLGDLRARGFDYVVVAAGAQVGLPLGIEGEEGAGVLDGLELLRAARRGSAHALCGRVGVIGGGDVAMDCARTAQRLGASEVSILYRRTRAEMPAQDEEIEAVLEEGIAIVELLAPRAARLEGGRLAALQGDQMRLGEPDASGRRRPVATDRSLELGLEALIVAIGQRPDLSFVGAEAVALHDKGWIEVDPDTMRSSLPWLYAGGDVSGAGPSNIVAALADGRRIADDIRRREEGYLPASRPRHEGELADLLRRRAWRVWRVAVPQRGLDRRGGFEEVLQTLSDTAAAAEAERCLDCDLLCSTCVSVCPNLAFFTYQVAPAELSLPSLVVEDRASAARVAHKLSVRQGPQVAVLADFCNECGNCETFCPTAGAPYRDKPRLYLDSAEFEQETDNAFMLELEAEGWKLRARVGGATHELAEKGEIVYSVGALRATLDPSNLALLDLRGANSLPDDARPSPETLGRMLVLGRGLAESAAHLPFARAGKTE